MSKRAKVTLKNAVLAMCHECLGWWEDGKQDCECVRCPLYSWQKYAKKEPDLAWTRFNPSRVGRVTWDDSSPNLSDEARLAQKERLMAMRSRRKDEEAN